MINSKAEASYLAGILDGEGCIGVYSNKGLRYIISIANTSEDLMVWLKAKLPIGSVSVTPEEAYKQTAYRWSLSNPPHIWELLVGVRPYLIVKYLHADLMIKLLNPLHIEERNKGKLYAEVFKGLNARGTNAEQLRREARVKGVALLYDML